MRFRDLHASRAQMRRPVLWCAVLVTFGACADVLTEPPYVPPSNAQLSATGGAIDLPELMVDLPSQPRPWDEDDAALEAALDGTDRLAFIGVKNPGAARLLSTGRTERLEVFTARAGRKGTRAAISEPSVRAGLNALRAAGVDVKAYYQNLGIAYVAIPRGSAAAVRVIPFVDYVEPENRSYALDGISLRANARSTTLISQVTPWGISLVRAPEAWALTSGAGARLLVIDTGHDRGHEDLPYVDLSQCFGFFGGCDDAYPVPHGTHVTGTAIARNNGVGVVGVAPTVAASDAFFWGACDNSGLPGSCNSNQIIQAFDWAAGSLGPRSVINVSLSGSVSEPAMATAVASAWSAGHVIVAAAGNTGTQQIRYPAGYSNVLGVSGLLPTKAFASTGSPCSGAGSTWGEHVDFSAPWYALSTTPGNTYENESQGWCGTSFATPHVAGAALLVRAANPSWTNTDVVWQLAYTAERLGGSQQFGAGLVRADQAIGLYAPSITATISAGKPRLTWPAVPLATTYRIYRRVTPDLAPEWVLWASTSTTSYVDGLTRVTSFYGYNSHPTFDTAVSYYVTSVSALGIESGYTNYATYIPSGTPIY